MMNAIHIIMATSTSANPHTAPNTRIESLARKRKVSAIAFFVFGILLIVVGALLASFEKQRFSVSFIVFGAIGVIFGFMYWISAEKILSTLRKLNAERLRQARFQAQNAGTVTFGNMDGFPAASFHMELPSYEQSVSPIDIPPPYEEAIKLKSRNENTTTHTSSHRSSVPIHSISLAVDQATTNSREIPNRKRSAPTAPFVQQP